MKNTIYDIYEQNFQISKKVLSLAQEVLENIREPFLDVDRIREYNQIKVIRAMQENELSEACFSGTTGYGYDDKGRKVLDCVFAKVFCAQDALVRHQFVSGTHALAMALGGNLARGQEMLSVTGEPYDTLGEVIGLRGNSASSLKNMGIHYQQTDLLKDGIVDFKSVKEKINAKTRVVFIQRSRGYSQRPSLSIEKIGEIVSFVKHQKPDVCVMVDNCYGEFVEEREPTEVGADLVVGSLIKNPGGGIAPTGGYVAGTRECVENTANRLICPGMGKEVGATLGLSRYFFQGLFFAPHVVAEALKGALFGGAFMEKLGFKVYPTSEQKRSDIIQAIRFDNREALIAFCQGIQSGSPVDSFVKPEPWKMPGYDSEVIMAAGAFIQGSSIELSADAPIRPPYMAYMQGGLVFEHVKLGVMMAAQNILKIRSMPSEKTIS
jgi:cystathionine beta-lyase family protein involved in aluminum resistance